MPLRVWPQVQEMLSQLTRRNEDLEQDRNVDDWAIFPLQALARTLELDSTIARTMQDAARRRLWLAAALILIVG